MYFQFKVFISPFLICPKNVLAALLLGKGIWLTLL